MSGAFETKIDFSRNFSEIKTWTYTHEKHHEGLNTTEVMKLLATVNVKVAGLNGIIATDDDKKTVKSAMAFIMKHSKSH